MSLQAGFTCIYNLNTRRLLTELMWPQQARRLSQPGTTDLQHSCVVFTRLVFWVIITSTLGSLTSFTIV